MKSNVGNIVTVIDFIEDNLTGKLDLASIADAVGYSKYHLHRMFTNMVGLSIHDYVSRRQLTEAAKLLVFSKRPILEIALLAGYESQQAFSISFKQMYKKSPNEYRINGEFYPLQLRFTLKKELSLPSQPNELKENIEFADISDIPLWMELVDLIIDGFPNLKKEEYLETLKQCIHEKRALILKNEGIAVAVMALNYDTGSIDFFGVHPLYRKHGITKSFLDKVMDELLKNRPLCVTTFREGDKADTGYRKEYKALGFAEAELLTEFGYPTQRLVLAPKSENAREDEAEKDWRDKTEDDDDKTGGDGDEQIRQQQ